MIHNIGCHGGEERLIDCESEEYDAPNAETTVQIVSIKCGNDDVTPAENTTVCENCDDASDDTGNSSSGSQSILVAAITIAVLCFSLLIGAITAYIIFTYVRQKKGRYAIK